MSNHVVSKVAVFFVLQNSTLLNRYEKSFLDKNCAYLLKCLSVVFEENHEFWRSSTK